MEVVPAIIPQSAAHLRTVIDALNGAAPSIQIDLVDGTYAPSISWPFSGDGLNKEALALFAEIAQAHAVEVDLMVAEPEMYIPGLIASGVSRIAVHLKSTGRLDTILAEKAGVAIGVAIETDDRVASLAPYASRIDFVQCMGIATIGLQGQPFDDRVLAQIKEVRATFPNLEVSVDGGVTMFTLSLLKAAGATRFVAGSAIVNAADPLSAHAELSRLADA